MDTFPGADGIFHQATIVSPVSGGVQTVCRVNMQSSLFAIIPAEEMFNGVTSHSPGAVPAHLSAATSKEQIRQAFHTAVPNL